MADYTYTKISDLPLLENDLTNSTTFLAVLSNNSTIQVSSSSIKDYILNSIQSSRRHDWQIPYSYCGKAVEGSLDSDPVWNIARIELSVSGTTTITHATNVAWDDRLTAIYG